MMISYLMGKDKPQALDWLTRTSKTFLTCNNLDNLGSYIESVMPLVLSSTFLLGIIGITQL